MNQTTLLQSPSHVELLVRTVTDLKLNPASSISTMSRQVHHRFEDEISAQFIDNSFARVRLVTHTWTGPYGIWNVESLLISVLIMMKICGILRVKVKDGQIS